MGGYCSNGGGALSIIMVKSYIILYIEILILHIILYDIFFE